VIGVSKDTVKSHDNFAAKHDLNFPLVSDPEKDVCRAYGVFKEKTMYGKKVMGVERSTFLIDADGNLARVWRKVKVAGHAEEVLEAVKEL
jgi:peroxiredoxin Q/BCP